MKKCKWCGEEFEQTSNGIKIYCNIKCSQQHFSATNRKGPRKCKVCDCWFTSPAPNTKYCDEHRPSSVSYQRRKKRDKERLEPTDKMNVKRKVKRVCLECGRTFKKEKYDRYQWEPINKTMYVPCRKVLESKQCAKQREIQIPTFSYSNVRSAGASY